MSHATNSQDVNPFDVIKVLNLTQMPGGNYFRDTYESDVTVAGSALPPRFGNKDHVLSSAIYNMFMGSSVVPLHRLEADEVWHAYLGSSCIALAEFHIATGIFSFGRFCALLFPHFCLQVM